MSASTGQTIYYTTVFDTAERCGVIEESTSMGYKINGSWYKHSEIRIRNVLLDSKTAGNSKQLLFG